MKLELMRRRKEGTRGAVVELYTQELSLGKEASYTLAPPIRSQLYKLP